jgi:hypothetical protein
MASHSLIKRMVENGLGITLLCRSEVRRECEVGWLKALRLIDLRMPHCVVMVFHRDKPMFPALSTFIDFLVDSGEHFQGLFAGETSNNKAIEKGPPLPQSENTGSADGDSPVRFEK